MTARPSLTDSGTVEVVVEPRRSDVLVHACDDRRDTCVSRARRGCAPGGWRSRSLRERGGSRSLSRP